MNTMNDDQLKAAAQWGDTNLLYTLIQEDPYILEHIDSIPFVETPLHIAVSFGQLQFATEVMNLKPSFAKKLNRQGYSPIHLAMMQRGQERMVLRFVDIDKELVRVKGREGLTPLPLASKSGKDDLLAIFLDACPKSIEDVTVRNETALHIAVKSNQYEALQVLVGWLKRNDQKDAMNLEKTILNRKDEEGNTILHISALIKDTQALGLLVKTKVNLNSKNLKNSTALDIATKNLENPITTLDIAANKEITGILYGAGVKHGSSDAPSTLAKKLRSKTTVKDQIMILIRRMQSDISEEQRNAYLVVLALVATAAFQSALSPPGGVYQANAGDNNVNTNTTSLNSTAPATQGHAGASVMFQLDFVVLSDTNTISLLVLTIMMFALLIPSGTMGVLVALQVHWLLSSYCYPIKVIAPSSVISDLYYCYFFLWLFGLFSSILSLVMPGTWISGQLVRLLRKVRNLYNILLARLDCNNIAIEH